MLITPKNYCTLEFDMNVAITATGSKPTSDVDSRFGRAPWVLVYDTESKSWEPHEVTSATAARGAGIQAAENISRLGATVLITGACGPNAFQTLSAAGIKIYAGGGRTVEEAVRDFERGQLHELTGANGPNR